MSLLLLFLPHGGVPPNPQSAFTPAVIYAIETTRPSIDVKTAAPSLYTANITSPSMYYVQNVLGEFENSDVEYSSSTVEYSSSEETYGGMDRIQPILSTLDSIDSAKPVVYSIEKV